MRYFRSIICITLFVSVIAAQQYQQASQFAINQQSGERQQVRDSETSPAAVAYRARPYQYSSEEEDDVSTYTRRQQPQQQQQQQQQNKKYKKPQYEEEELEEEEPDRLSLLLGKSSFHCTDRTTGYYADESLGCEVFHYCQENQKHSWICPEGFTFHQVHLICMPPSGDNICEQSSKYHFVNDYLYKPINMEEHQTKPNVTLRYSERYYPENFYTDERRYDDERQQRQHQERHAPRVQQQQQQPQQQQVVRKNPVNYSPTTPLPYRLASSQQQHNVFRSPEEINISLQQRRPNFSPTTARYEEDEEYGSYEK